MTRTQQARAKEIKVITTKQLNKIFTDAEGKVYRLSVQMYTGKKKVRVKEIMDLIPIKAYGVKILVKFENTEEPTEHDLGYLTGEGYEIGALFHALTNAQVENFEHLRQTIRLTAATWGELVYDLNGLAVLLEGGVGQRRDPYIQAARRALDRLLSKASNSLKAASSAMAAQAKGNKGVGL